MTITLVKFRKNWYKTVGGISPTMYNLSIHFVIYNGGKMVKFNMRKKYKKKSQDYIQTTCISSDHDQNTVEVSKE